MVEDRASLGFESLNPHVGRKDVTERYLLLINLGQMIFREFMHDPPM